MKTKAAAGTPTPTPTATAVLSRDSCAPAEEEPCRIAATLELTEEEAGSDDVTGVGEMEVERCRVVDSPCEFVVIWALVETLDLSQPAWLVVRVESQKFGTGVNRLVATEVSGNGAVSDIFAVLMLDVGLETTESVFIPAIFARARDLMIASSSPRTLVS